MSITAIPNSQKHESIVPAYIPIYNHILVTPNQSRNETVLSLNSNSDAITFEISGDNCVNLSKSYFEFILDYTTGQTRAHAAADSGNWDMPFVPKRDTSANNLDKLTLKNTMNFGTLKVYNKTGTLLCDLDTSYNEYRDLAHEIANQFPYDLKEPDYYKKIFDGLGFNTANQKIGENLLCHSANTLNPSGGVQNYYVMQNGMTDTLHGQILCRFHFADIYNTILALKNDIYFGEVIYIQFTFAPIMNWVHHNDGDKYINQWQAFLGMKIVNPHLYVCYNKDPTCNANTINYSTHHPIDFTDFNIVQITKDPIPGNSTFNYNFSINSSIGSYVKFILYRAYINDAYIRTIVPFDKEEDRIRWQINDFVYTPDYLYPAKYQTWEYMRNIIQNTLYEKCSAYSFPYRFFDVLNFSTDRLTELKLRAGKDLASDLKITLDCSNHDFDTAKNTYTIHHKFYIITGKQLVIGPRGVEKVV